MIISIRTREPWPIYSMACPAYHIQRNFDTFVME